LPVSAARRSAVFAPVLSVVLVLALVPVEALAKDPPQIARFMNAIGQVESGGRYDARNKYSGAYGKYQIMPSNWPSWAKRYLGNANAPQTPANQERVARGKFTDLYNKLKSWPVVARWWLTGSSDPNRANWSAYSAGYVDKVMAAMKTASDVPPWPKDVPKPPAPKPTPTPPGKPPKPTATPTPPSEVPAVAATTKRYQDTNGAIKWTGFWSTAQYHAYAGDSVRYATTRGAGATLTFRGSSVTWIGPVGPTRGRARVYVDGQYVRTVDLRSSSFMARRALFTTSWSKAGSHTLRIVVMGTPGRPYVAIDEFRVRS
jgi:hypothetical protein